MLVLKDVLALLDGELLTPSNLPEPSFPRVFASDLMSDVLAFMDAGSILLTGLVNAHVVRTACLAEVRAIIVVQARRSGATRAKTTPADVRAPAAPDLKQVAALLRSARTDSPVFRFSQTGYLQKK